MKIEFINIKPRYYRSSFKIKTLSPFCKNLKINSACTAVDGIQQNNKVQPASQAMQKMNDAFDPTQNEPYKFKVGAQKMSYLLFDVMLYWIHKAITVSLRSLNCGSPEIGSIYQHISLA